MQNSRPIVLLFKTSRNAQSESGSGSEPEMTIGSHKRQITRGYHTFLRHLLFACNSTSGTVRNAIQRSFSHSFQPGFLGPAKLPF